MKSDRQQFADRLLDASLEHLSIVEPRQGLEGRILAGVGGRRRATRRNWALGLAFSTLAVFAVIFTVLAPRKTAVPVAPAERGVSTAPKAATSPTPSVLPARVHPRVAKARRPRAVPPRPQQFPTPAPLSKQEKLLLAYVKAIPPSELAAQSASAAAELEIPELKIAAVEIKDLPSVNDGN